MHMTYADEKTITISWVGNRVLRGVKLPRERMVLSVIYMRDGLMCLENGAVLPYVRTLDDYPNNTIILSLEGLYGQPSE